MIPSLRETLLALHGLREFARTGAPALQWFDRSMAGFWRSFGVSVLVLPPYAALLATQLAAPPDSDGWIRLIVAEGSAYVLMWVAFPLALYYIARGIGRTAEYVDFVIVNNWMAIVVTVLGLAAALIRVSGLVPDALSTLIGVVITIGLLSFEWFVACQALRIERLAAVGVVFLDFIITFVIQFAVSALTGQ